jgi:phosphoribosyl 1,2-cyclic phosphodiesterase
MKTTEASTKQGRGAAAGSAAGGLSVCMLASGSRGNAIYVSDGSTSLLFDAGLSGIEIERRMASRGLAPGDLDAIVVSHEHNDHVNAVGVLARRFNLPVYINPGTLQAADRLGALPKTMDFECGALFRINTLSVRPFSISHDAADPVGFTVERNGRKIAIATDLGIVTAMVREHLRGAHILVLEANHDPDMLINGPYSWPLKQRIRSRLGHLSNQDTRELLKSVAHPALQHVILAHLSETNNTPHKALAEVSLALDAGRIRFTVSCQDRCGELITTR